MDQSNWIQCCQQLPTAATFFWKELCCAGAMTRRWAPSTRNRLRRNAASIMRDLIWIKCDMTMRQNWNKWGQLVDYCCILIANEKARLWKCSVFGFATTLFYVNVVFKFTRLSLKVQYYTQNIIQLFYYTVRH